MHFGKWIVVAFVLFAVFIASLVTICVREDVSLVSSDYYQQELDHQQKITLVENALSLQSLPDISIQGSVVTITYADFNKVEKGVLKLLRPSDQKLDRNFSFKHSVGDQQHFPLKGWSKGLYRASMEWTMEGKEYYFEKLIVL